MDFLKTQNEVVVVDIPEQIWEAEKAKIAKKERKLKHNILYQFTKLRVYTTAIIAYILSLVCRYAYYYIDVIIFGENDKGDSNKNQKLLENEIKKKKIIIILSVCILAPIIEEFIFRSIIFKIINWLGKKVQKNAKILGIIIRILAFVISSFIFAFAHFGFSYNAISNLIRIFPQYLIAGLFLAFAYNRDGYILASILSHIINNVIAVICIIVINDKKIIILKQLLFLFSNVFSKGLFFLQ